MNEALCRSLIQAHLSEEDVAARLEVDPKTVRRWLDGRIPYLRYRWALAAMLGKDETDLWPGLRRAPSRPEEVWAIYPRLDDIPREMWLEFFGSAQRDISILADELPAGADPLLIAVLADRAQAGARVRICLAGPGNRHEERDVTGRPVGKGQTWIQGLPDTAGVSVRLLVGDVYQSVYRADDQLLAAQHVHGVPGGRSPVLHLHLIEHGALTAAYLESFEHMWAHAQTA